MGQIVDALCERLDLETVPVELGQHGSAELSSDERWVGPAKILPYQLAFQDRRSVTFLKTRRFDPKISRGIICFAGTIDTHNRLR